MGALATGDHSCLIPEMARVWKFLLGSVLLTQTGLQGNNEEQVQVPAPFKSNFVLV